MIPLQPQGPASKANFGAGFARSLWLAALCGFGPSAHAAGPVDGGPEPPLESQDSSTLPSLTEILSILSSSSEGQEGRGLALAFLVSKGPRTVAAISAILSGSATIPDKLQQDGPLLTPDREALLMDAIRAWDSRRVASELQTQLEARPSLALRALSIRILGQTGDARCLEPFLEIVAGFDPIQFMHPSVRKPAVQAMSAMLQRDSLSYVSLGVLIQEFDPEMVEFSIEGIARAGRADGVELLHALLDRNPRTDEMVLAALSGLGLRDLALVAPEVRAIVRPYLSSVNEGSRVQAARTLGTLGDHESFIKLAELLDDPNDGVVESALNALRAMSGTSWPAVPAGWLQWHKRELAWLNGPGEKLSQALTEGAPDAAVKALRKLAQHPLFAARLAETLGTAVRHDNRTVAVLACEALGRLDCPDTLAPLVEALYDPRDDVREAAATSLRTSTGVDLPSDGAMWRDWLKG